MKFIKYLLTGIVFGIILSKAEVISWYRIYEMFRFESFHMFGVIGSAVVVGAILLLMIKKVGAKDIDGQLMQLKPKENGFKALLFGGVIFGLGWAMTGACPGPMFIIVGYGTPVFLVVILSATLGAFLYGALRKYLPH
ncbi:YeeE/YedE family protein [Reichenbachiella agarivorans]|uniref:YeeE/YedE family protein n=1 Tax=Reichenbachiella agarivorans TaxID=2979464 RepID=A0ABY6CXI5_9BACT|nr:YeeE/YedE family protein [Reichenbachiella agarivorans]UXP34108.1 YeeE/YedE family protein [Reichenbachiella agarivorans]